MTAKRGWSALLIVAGLLLFMWPALVNRGPFLHPDTSNYVRAADGAVVALTGQRSVWSDRLVAAETVPPTGAGAQGQAGWSTLRPTRTVLSGRSIYYGMTLFVLMELLGRWGPVVFQAGVALATVLVATRVATRELPHRDAVAWVVVAVLGLATPLPFYAAMLMPDLFAGLLALALATLVVFRARLTVPARVFLGAVAAGSIVFHTSHVLLTLLIGAAMLVLHLAHRRWRALPALNAALVVVPGLVVLAMAAQLAYGAAVRHAIGIAPISPPFLSARMIDHGPGLTLLRESCPASGYALCDHLSILPVDSDDFLWAKTPDKGVFTAASPEEKRRLAAEDRRFFVDVLRTHPVDTVLASLDAMRRQATMLGYRNFNLVAIQRAGFDETLPGWAHAWQANTRAYRRTMPTALPDLLAAATTLLAIAGFGAALLLRRTPAPVLVLGGLLFAAVLFNAAICGALSKPHERYQMRIVWLLPLAAMLALSPATAGRRGARADRRVPA